LKVLDFKKLVDLFKENIPKKYNGEGGQKTEKGNEL
jgi:hypothetical protein